ncbi:hypothetical protein SAMN04488104_1007115 [Algoriphagus faecimaris]|uniref:Uncharacterized protein n=1 Tax=Algoriphagus faecimaris TaxID=686796 RepID=A0A1G6PY81_9BACT|nr:hypothetical protein SAMN04488104_1007115 [Algoriphagus faecimaris]
METERRRGYFEPLATGTANSWWKVGDLTFESSSKQSKYFMKKILCWNLREYL